MKTLAALLLFVPLWAEKPPYPLRWVFYTGSLGSDAQVEQIRGIARTASEHGLNGIVFSIGLDSITRQNAGYLARLDQVKQICRDYALDFIPQIFSAGYGSGLSGYDRNLAEGLPVRDALYTVRGAEARLEADPAVVVVNGSLEDFDNDRVRGYNLQDGPGVISFVDRNIYKTGSASLRFENFTAQPAGNARLMQEIAVKPYRQYRLKFWWRTEGMPNNALRFQVLTLSGDNVSPWESRLSGNADWTEQTWGFNSGANERLRLYVGVWGGRAGKFWVDDLSVEEVGLLNVLRREGTPVTVRSDDGETVFAEGRDFEPIRDPLLNFRFDHDGPSIRLLPGSRIRDGERLRVSYFHSQMVMDQQVSFCMSEPAVYEYWRAQAQRIHELIGAKRYLLSMDEIRLGGSCEACKRRQISMAQILGDALTRQFEILRENDPEAEVWVWSDMLDPNHNAHANYYLVDGDYTGSWEYIPKDLNIMCWYYSQRRPSLKHFSSLGHKTAAGAYYDGSNLDNPMGWLEALDETPDAIGIMYTTWENKYDLLAPFGDLVSQPRP